MKKYSVQNNHWKESKALGFFLNFINNHKGTVNDNDTFALVASLRSKEEWIDLAPPQRRGRKRRIRGAELQNSSSNANDAASTQTQGGNHEN